MRNICFRGVDIDSGRTVKGDLLNGPFWMDTEDDMYSAHIAWLVDFGSGYCGSTYKHNTFAVRTVAAL